jgi:hypothetical protein
MTAEVAFFLVYPPLPGPNPADGPVDGFTSVILYWDIFEAAS